RVYTGESGDPAQVGLAVLVTAVTVGVVPVVFEVGQGQRVPPVGVGGGDLAGVAREGGAQDRVARVVERVGQPETRREVVPGDRARSPRVVERRQQVRDERVRLRGAGLVGAGLVVEAEAQVQGQPALG